MCQLLLSKTFDNKGTMLEHDNWRHWIKLVRMDSSETFITSINKGDY